MKYIEIQNEIIKIDEIIKVEKDEKERSIYLYFYHNGSNYHTIIDYENVKDNINDEKTEVQKDYDKIKNVLIPEKQDENKIKELENQIEMYKLTLNNISQDISRYKQNLRNIINDKKLNKIKRLKEVI